MIYSVAFKTHLAAAMARLHPVVWHLHEFPPAATGRMWKLLARRVPDHLIANSQAVGEAWGNGRREEGGGPGERVSGEHGALRGERGAGSGTLR